MVISSHGQRWCSHHLIRHSPKPHHAAHKLDGSLFYRTGLIADQSFTLREKGISRLFCSCDLDLDSMTFIYELDPYPLKMYLQTKDKLST